MHWILTFTILTLKLVFSKPYDINEVLRIQMARIARRYEMQKNTPGHQLKDKGTLDLIKRDLKIDFQKSKNVMIRKLQRQQAQNRRNSIKTELFRTKRSIIDGAIGVNKVIRPDMEKLIKEYNAQKMAEGHVYESIKDEKSLKLLKNEIKNSFRKTVILTGQNTTPNRKRRLERLQKHYGINFEAPKSEWYRHFGLPSME